MILGSVQILFGWFDLSFRIRHLKKVIHSEHNIRVNVIPVYHYYNQRELRIWKSDSIGNRNFYSNLLIVFMWMIIRFTTFQQSSTKRPPQAAELYQTIIRFFEQIYKRLTKNDTSNLSGLISLFIPAYCFVSFLMILKVFEF